MGMFNAGWFRRRHAATSSRTAMEMVALPGEPDERDRPLAATGRLLIAVIYASETGVAEHLAHDTCQALQDAGVAVRLAPFDALELDTLRDADCALFVVSTCADGDPPQMAAEFVRAHLQHPAALARLHYGLLALGDSYYDEFCAFGRCLQHGLRASGAHALFEPVEMDDEDEAAARRWHDRVEVVVGRRGDAGHPAP